MSSTPYTNATVAELETPVPATDSAITEMKTVDKDDVVSVTSTVKIERVNSFDQSSADTYAKIEDLVRTFNPKTFEGLGTLQDYQGIVKLLQDMPPTDLDISKSGAKDVSQLSSATQEITKMLQDLSAGIDQTTHVNDSHVLEKTYEVMNEMNKLQIALQKFHLSVSGMATIKVPQTLVNATTSLKQTTTSLADAHRYLSHFVGLEIGEVPKNAALFKPRQDDIEDAMTTIEVLKHAEVEHCKQLLDSVEESFQTIRKNSNFEAIIEKLTSFKKNLRTQQSVTTVKL